MGVGSVAGCELPWSSRRRLPRTERRLGTPDVGQGVARDAHSEPRELANARGVCLRVLYVPAQLSSAGCSFFFSFLIHRVFLAYLVVHKQMQNLHCADIVPVVDGIGTNSGFQNQLESRTVCTETRDSGW